MDHTNILQEWASSHPAIVQLMTLEYNYMRNATVEATDAEKRCEAIEAYWQYLFRIGKERYSKISECAGQYFEEYISTPTLNRIRRRIIEDIEKDI